MFCLLFTFSCCLQEELIFLSPTLHGIFRVQDIKSNSIILSPFSCIWMMEFFFLGLNIFLRYTIFLTCMPFPQWFLFVQFLIEHFTLPSWCHSLIAIFRYSFEKRSLNFFFEPTQWLFSSRNASDIFSNFQFDSSNIRFELYLSFYCIFLVRIYFQLKFPFRN